MTNSAFLVNAISKRRMFQTVLRARCDFKVTNVVIQGVMISMVNNLSGQQPPTEKQFHDEAMFSNLSSVNSPHTVPIRVNVTPTCPHVTTFENAVLTEMS
jgi:hypothetical protein